ncbi:MAG TPA: amidohydrolase [Chitinophagaceae bacterium]|nr:amidohydrolase [Chitinophagaceae bacterium]
MNIHQIKALNANLDGALESMLPEMEAIYKDIHQHPELSMEEKRTAKLAADYLRKYHWEVAEGIGGTGVVGVLNNGPGPTVMLRADMDALPVTEATGLPYASTVKAKDSEGREVGVSHVCGHDFHVTWLMGAARLLAEHQALWAGTVLAVFQPGEEEGRGARAMIDDGMISRFPKPDIILGQHVMVGIAGSVGHRSGAILAGGDSLKVKLFGRGSHGSQPHTSIDPVVMAAATTLRLQTIISREIDPNDSAVLTVGSLQAGTKENIIPDDAELKLNIRTFDEEVRHHILESVKRVCCAECMASNAPKDPEISTISYYPLTENDEQATARIAEAFGAQFGDQSYETPRRSASEDFSIFGREWKVPYVFWFVGGTDRDVFLEARKNKAINKIPSNHSPKFAPVLHPTLKTGFVTMVTAAAVWLNAR